MTWPPKSKLSNVRVTFDIVYDISIRYRSVFVRYWSHETSILVTLLLTFDLEGWWPSISISNNFDIEIRYWRCKSSISNEHMILKSSISKVTFAISKVRHSITGWQGIKIREQMGFNLLFSCLWQALPRNHFVLCCQKTLDALPRTHSHGYQPPFFKVSGTFCNLYIFGINDLI